MRSALWSIAFGDYELIVDRRTLTFRLTETKTGTLWADGVSLGWMAVESRETGEIVRHGFGAMQQVSVSEKAGPQGKRILFGLECEGIPVDVYLICSLREIQIQVEANRDSTSHWIHSFGLTPGLCAIPDDGRSYLVIPQGEGAILFAKDAPPEPQILPIWNATSGVNMPFVGAVRTSPPATRSAGTRLSEAERGTQRVPGAKIKTDSSALVLITDSAYGSFRLSRPTENAVLDIGYERDPERRRLDLRIVLLPSGDHVSIAHTYREKIIGENNHLTLRKKMRERPSVNDLIGAFTLFANLTSEKVRELLQGEIETDTIFIVTPEPSADHHFEGTWLAMDPLTDHPTRWSDMDTRLETLRTLQSKGRPVGSLGNADWSAIAVDFWMGNIGGKHGLRFHPVPLYSVVYHDVVIEYAILWDTAPVRFLRCLINLSLLAGTVNEREAMGTSKPRMLALYHSVLGTLHPLTFAAFLIAHRFLSDDFLVEEAIYSDKTRIVINQSDTETYETAEFALPPLGFYVHNPQIEAHNAIRIGETTFVERAWRIRKSTDGKPLGQSTAIEETVHPLSP